MIHPRTTKVRARSARLGAVAGVSYESTHSLLSHRYDVHSCLIRRGMYNSAHSLSAVFTR